MADPVTCSKCGVVILDGASLFHCSQSVCPRGGVDKARGGTVPAGSVKTIEQLTEEARKGFKP